jgi:hypothetical protein
MISSDSGFFPLNLVRKEEKSKKKARIKVAAEIGREIKIENDPSEMIKDLRKACSIRGPKTKAIISGAPSYLNFLIR